MPAICGKIDFMVRIAVCDDEKEIIAELELTLADILDGMDVDHKIDVYHSGVDLCSALKTGFRYDLIFLDIAFSENEINGVETGWMIREIHNDNAVSIVYISWIERYAMHLFKIRPMDFLIKPLTRGKIQTAVETYFRIISPPWGDVEFVYKKGHATHSVWLKEIVYLEARDRKVVLHLCNGTKDDFYGNLKDTYENQLKEYDFLFIHASYAVNYDYITAIKYSDLHITDSQSPLPVSQSRRNEVRERYTAIMKRRRAK